MFEVHIVGAGPAGCISAISAITSHNYNVLISEEHESAGFPARCSGLFSKDGLESLSDFIDYKRTIKNRINGALIDFAGERIEVKRGEDVAYVCDRAAFDRALAERAEKEGAKIEYNKRITTHYEANNIIGADGPHSAVASHFDFPRIERWVATLQTFARYEAENQHYVEVFLSNRLFPGFFGWVIPQNEEVAEFGVGVRLPNNPYAALMALLKLKNICDVKKPVGAVIPLAARVRTAAKIGKRSVLLVGDAAGQTKASSGGGVIIGGQCAVFAGRLVQNPMRYEKEWRVKFGLDIFIHQLVRRFLDSNDDVSLSEIGRFTKRLRLDSYLSEHGHMDSPTKSIKPALFIHLLRNLHWLCL